MGNLLLVINRTKKPFRKHLGKPQPKKKRRDSDYVHISNEYSDILFPFGSYLTDVLLSTDPSDNLMVDQISGHFVNADVFRGCK